jgi:large subunit ribosomal protein L4
MWCRVVDPADEGKSCTTREDERDMATIDVYNLSGAKAGTMELAEEVFGAVNEDLLWEAITHYRAAARAGTHATKNRWRVSGSGKKLWKQKGTGRARIGSIRSPLWRHGGTVHGPQPRSYDYAFPEEEAAGRAALGAGFEVCRWQADGREVVRRERAEDEAVSRGARQAEIEGTTLLVDISTAENKNLELSSRNIDGLELVRANEVHPYHIMRYTHVVFAQPALEKLQDSLKKSASRRQHEAEPPKKRKKKKPAGRSRENAK